MTFAIVALPHPISETDKQLLLVGLGGIEEIQVLACVQSKFNPVPPVGCAKGIIHCCSFNCVPTSIKS
jgi:hypothetical protein